jgi:hypothetical protein
VNERAQRLDDRLEPWYLVAALLVIPDVAIEATTQSGGWSQVAFVLNWAVWLTFAVGLVWTTALADARWRWLRGRPLDVAIVVLTPPFAPGVLLGFRLTRLLRLLRLLRLVRTANLTRKTFSLEGVKWAAALVGLVALGGGAAFASAEHRSTSDGLWWGRQHDDHGWIRGRHSEHERRESHRGRRNAGRNWLRRVSHRCSRSAIRRSDRGAKARVGASRPQRPRRDQSTALDDREANSRQLGSVDCNDAYVGSALLLAGDAILVAVQRMRLVLTCRVQLGADERCIGKATSMRTASP